MEVEKIDTFSGHRDCVYTLERGSESFQFFSAGGDGLVVRWDLRKPDAGELFAQIPASIYGLCFDNIKNQLWIGQNFEGIHLIDVESKEEINSIKITFNGNNKTGIKHLLDFLDMPIQIKVAVTILLGTVHILLMEDLKSRLDKYYR